MAFYCNGKKGVCECDILCDDCQHYDNTCGKKLQTNADRIRAMSDEDLEDFLLTEEWMCDTYISCSECPLRGEKGCISILEWLKQPVKENDNDEKA